ncbi:uncharacterized protein LOC122438496 [Cervus canadensis]|uniref:uncharacterized protein LOC122438496 n=1 Tax=Cervus canadensis TaxID=1574408 RepID=UPI001C9E96B0|nr:uncharacterized protein LOC122438496 [Cervus canadensis]
MAPGRDQITGHRLLTKPDSCLLSHSVGAGRAWKRARVLLPHQPSSPSTEGWTTSRGVLGECRCPDIRSQRRGRRKRGSAETRRTALRNSPRGRRPADLLTQSSLGRPPPGEPRPADCSSQPGKERWTDRWDAW